MRDNRILVDDIEQAIGRIEGYVSSMSRDEFLLDEKTQATVLWELLAHGYYRAESDVVWDMVEEDLPTLKEQIRSIQADMSGGSGGAV